LSDIFGFLLAGVGVSPARITSGHIEKALQPPLAAELVHAIQEPLQALEVRFSFNRHEIRFSFLPCVAPALRDCGSSLGRVPRANQLPTCAFH
jgi:hypothetical protein